MTHSMMLHAALAVCLAATVLFAVVVWPKEGTSLSEGCREACGAQCSALHARLRAVGGAARSSSSISSSSHDERRDERRSILDENDDPSEHDPSEHDPPETQRLEYGRSDGPDLGRPPFAATWTLELSADSVGRHVGRAAAESTAAESIKESSARLKVILAEEMETVLQSMRHTAGRTPCPTAGPMVAPPGPPAEVVQMKPIEVLPWTPALSHQSLVRPLCAPVCTSWCAPCSMLPSSAIPTVLPTGSSSAPHVAPHMRSSFCPNVASYHVASSSLTSLPNVKMIQASLVLEEPWAAGQREERQAHEMEAMRARLSKVPRLIGKAALMQAAAMGDDDFLGDAPKEPTSTSTMVTTMEPTWPRILQGKQEGKQPREWNLDD